MANGNGHGRLAGKTAVITGGSSGLGLESARQFIAEGARVIITGTTADKLEAAAQGLGPQATPVVADVRSPEALEALAQRARETFGRVDIVFANAGIGVFGPLEQIDAAAFDEQFAVNVRGVLLTVQKLLPLLGEGSSVILNASGVNAKGAPGASLYFASKAAVRSLARSLAAELGPRGIRVNALSPGLVITDFQKRMGLSAEELDGFAQSIVGSAPLGRTGEPLEIARAAVFLASDDSSYMAGSDLVVDGGFMNV